MQFARERVTPELCEEIAPLLRAHHAEILPADAPALSPNLAGYKAAEEVGALRVFTVRDGKRLCGYAVFSIYFHAHFAHMKYAAEDIIYLAPEFRGKGTGHDFILWCDLEMKASGVDVVRRFLPLSSTHRNTLERAGYKATEISFERTL